MAYKLLGLPRTWHINLSLIHIYKNAGGNNENKNSRALNQTVEYMKNKWGKYYDHNFKTNQSRINVKR